jgi:hypothetical protein
MRYLILLASLALAANALADEKPRSVAKELDKSSPQLVSADAPSDSTASVDAREKHNKAKSRAQDYNSSRSNTTAAADLQEGETDKEGVVHRDIAARKAQAREVGIRRATEASDGKVRAQDYNSSRSNTTAAREEKEGDLDRDGDGDGDNDTVVRKKPGKR